MPNSAIIAALSRIHPVVAWANYFQFERHTQISFPSVQSRMLVWGIHGQGVIEVNGTPYPLTPENFLLLPWNHAIRYLPDPNQPFLIGCVHLIPDHTPDVPVALTVAHSLEDVLYNAVERRDALIPGLDGVIQGSLSSLAALVHLAEYAVIWYQRRECTSQEAHMLGTLLMTEILRAVLHDEIDPFIPVRLDEILMYVRAHPRWKLTAQDLAIYARCSVPTLNRLFRRYLRQSPAQWMLQQRLTEAANLLGTTQISIGEIGRMVGIDDPYYFSRIFKRKYNMTPTHYRAMISLPMRG